MFIPLWLSEFHLNRAVKFTSLLPESQLFAKIDEIAYSGCLQVLTIYSSLKEPMYLNTFYSFLARLGSSKGQFISS